MKESMVVIVKRGWQFYALRDAVIVAVTLLSWWGSQSIETLGIIAGVGLGMSAYLFHEWAHLLAAIRQKASVEFATRWYAIFLFNMRSAVISKRAFFDISFAGFFATLLYPTLFSLASAFECPSCRAVACPMFSRIDVDFRGADRHLGHGYRSRACW